MFLGFACSGASCLSADKNPGIKPDVEDECVPQPLSPISREHRRGQGPGKHVRELSLPPLPFSLLPSSLTGRIKLEKVCGKDKREWWLTEKGMNANLFLFYFILFFFLEGHFVGCSLQHSFTTGVFRDTPQRGDGRAATGLIEVCWDTCLNYDK